MSRRVFLRLAWLLAAAALVAGGEPVDRISIWLPLVQAGAAGARWDDMTWDSGTVWG